MGKQPPFLKHIAFPQALLTYDFCHSERKHRRK